MSLTLYTAPTPDGYKVSVTLEELGLAYDVVGIDLQHGEQKAAAFLAINPNGRVPALVDDGFAVFESGAILLHLAEKAGRLIPADVQGRSLVVQWLMFQMGGIGPMMGQANVFHRYWPEKLPAVTARYQAECRRLFGVLDQQLATHEFLAGEFSIADIANWCWVRTAKWSGVETEGLRNLLRWKAAIAARPAVQRGLLVPSASHPPTEDSDAARTLTDRGRAMLDAAQPRPVREA